MKLKRFSKSGFEISQVVLGVLQIPEIAKPSKSSETKRYEALRYGIDKGVNYINLGHPYYCDNPSTACGYVKDALAGGYREKVQLAVNIPADLVGSQKDMDAYFNNQLAWFGTETFDVCIISGVYRGNWAKLKKLGLREWLDSLINAGKIKYAGLSFHDDPHLITPINLYYDKWSLIQFDYSFMDERHHPGSGGIVVAANHGLCVIASQCMKGGRLIDNLPEKVVTAWKTSSIIREPAEWAIRWVYNDKNVGAVQIEPTSVEETEKYLAYAELGAEDTLTLDDLLLYRSVVKAYEERLFFSCPACRCCMPCAIAVDAPRIAELYNEVCMYGDTEIPLFRYRHEGNGVPECINCGKCVAMCPRKNNLPAAIRKMMELSK